MNIENTPADFIEEVIKNRVNSVLGDQKIPDLVELVQTDSVAEVIEKLVILHIRNWMLEDQADITTNKEELILINNKIRQCNKGKRPKLVAALNKLIDHSIRSGESLVENSVKLYSGHKDQ